MSLATLPDVWEDELRMNKRLTLKIEWPGLTEDDLAVVAEGYGTIVDNDSSLAWILPLDCQEGVSEVVVRQSQFPMRDSSKAIYVRKINELKRVASIRLDGGLHHLLRTTDSKTVIDSIGARLDRFRDRLMHGGKVYIFAAHRNAAKCVHYCQDMGLDVVGFIDNDKMKQGCEYQGRRIYPLESIDPNAMIINASGRYCVEIKEQLLRSGYHWAIDLMELLFLYDLPFQAEGEFRKYITDTINNRLRIATLYLMLEDNFSRSVLDGLLLFRLTLDSTVVGNVASPYQEEFFAKDILSFTTGEVFVDGGAFDGDSYQRFAEMAPQFARAYLFEPDTTICLRAEQLIADDPRVSVCNFGLWSRTGELRFSSTGGMDGAICENGDICIRVVAIDEFIHEKVTHIKLDVEGAEEEALLGGRHQLGDSRPTMAVALYHRAADLWKIPLLIETLGGLYQYSIRHYSQTVDDSIVYAIPII